MGPVSFGSQEATVVNTARRDEIGTAAAGKESRTTGWRVGIQSIPQLLFFKDGAEKDRVVGAVPKREILKRLESLAD